MLKKMFLPSFPSVPYVSVLLLLARVFIGVMFLLHGMSKWMSYADLSGNFPDPLHIGSAWSLILVILSSIFMYYPQNL